MIEIIKIYKRTFSLAMILYLAGVVLILLNHFTILTVFFLHYLMFGMGTWVLISMYRRHKKFHGQDVT